MSTSRRPGWIRPALRRRALDASVLALAFALVPEVLWSNASLDPHPGWIAVLVLAARDGARGLFIGLLAAAAAVGFGSAVAGEGFTRPLGHLGSTPNLIAFGACLAVSCVASWHLQRVADLEVHLRAGSDRIAEADETIEELREAVGRLRTRVDRTSNSLSFLRDVAARLDGRDPIAAAEAAADLALTLTGAYAAAVHVRVGGSKRLLAVRDTRGPASPALPEVGAAPDVTVPVHDGGDGIGAILLWGVSRSRIDEATANDLDVIAAWAVPALALAAWRPEETIRLAWGIR